jgi:hypothetical protein
MMKIGSDSSLRVAPGKDGEDMIDADVGRDFSESYASSV